MAQRVPQRCAQTRVGTSGKAHCNKLPRQQAAGGDAMKLLRAPRRHLTRVAAEHHARAIAQALLDDALHDLARRGLCAGAKRGGVCLKRQERRHRRHAHVARAPGVLHGAHHGGNDRTEGEVRSVHAGANISEAQRQMHLLARLALASAALAALHSAVCEQRAQPAARVARTQAELHQGA